MPHQPGFFSYQPPLHFKTCRELGCVRIDPNTAATYESNGAIAIANTQKINAYIESMGNRSLQRRALLVDDRYAVCDDDADGADIYWGAITGGAIYTLGKSNDFRYATSPAGSNLWPWSSGGLVHCGDDGVTLFEYHGAYSYLDLCLIGGYHTNTATVADKIANDVASPLLKCQNIVDPDQDPLGLKTEFNLVCLLGRDGVVFEGATGSSYTDSPIVWNYHTEYLSGIAYKINEEQSLQHLVMKTGTNGYTMDKFFSLVRGGVLHVVEAFAPQGTLLHMGTTGAGALLPTASDVQIDHVQLDSNFGTTNVRLVDCEAGWGNTRVRMSVNTTHIEPWPNKQLIRRLESFDEDNSTQPDIQVDFKQLDPVEQCAYPRRWVRGATFDAEEFYPAPPITGVKLWLRASDQTDWVKATPDGLRWNTGDIVDTAEDKANVQPTLTSPGTGPKFRREGTNWRPALDFYDGEAASQHLVVTAPVDLHDAPASLFIAVVYTERQGTLGNDSYIVSCRNTDNTGGWTLVRAGSGPNQGKIIFVAGGMTIISSNAVTPYRPTLILANWNGSVGDLWVDGVKSEGTGGSLSAVTGHLVVGGTQNAATPTYIGCRGRIAELIVAENSLDIDDVDAGAGNAPLLSGWAPEAKKITEYLRSQYGVW